MIEQVFEHRFPSGLDLPIAVLTVSLDEIATRLCLEPECWDEDGLGPARGALTRLPSGRVVLIRELAHTIRHLRTLGPDLIADGGDVVSLGVGALVNEAVVALGLSKKAVAWEGGEDIRQSAARILAAVNGRS